MPHPLDGRVQHFGKYAIHRYIVPISIWRRGLFDYLHQAEGVTPEDGALEMELLAAHNGDVPSLYVAWAC